MERNVGSCMSSDTVLAKEEPLWEDITDLHSVSEERVYTNHEVNEEGLEPAMLQSVDAVFTSNAHVKEEVVECLKEETEREDKAVCGVGGSAELAALYAGHEVKDELVLGPEGLQPRDIAFTLHAARALHAEEQPVVKDCVVKLERVNLGAMLNKKHSNTDTATHGDACVCAICNERFLSYLKSQLKEYVTSQNMLKSMREPANEKETYRCHTCKKSFALKTQLEIHIKVMNHIHQNVEKRSKSSSETRDKRASCAGHRSDMDNDVNRVSNGTEKETYTCDTCNKSFALKTQLEIHTKVMNHIHLNAVGESNEAFSARAGQRGGHSTTSQESAKDAKKKPYSCSICGKAFALLGHLKQHEILHTGLKPYSCDICEKKFTYLCNLNQHEVVHTGLRAYSCRICGNKYKYSSDLKKHEVLHTGLEPYCCGICKKRFLCLANLKEHERIHTGLKPHFCEICKKSFTQFSTLRKHQSIHSDIKPYSCGICKKKFSLLGTLKIHERVHTGERPYSCDICKNTFRQLCHLQNHGVVHTGLKAYSCEICGNKFSQLINLKMHKLIHNRPERVKVTGKNSYSCRICKKKFPHLSNLRQHEVVHTGFKAYSCRTCEKRFTYLGNLKKHEVIHSGVKAYSCDLCKKSYRRLETLKIHKELLHTGNIPHS